VLSQTLISQCKDEGKQSEHPYRDQSMSVQMTVFKPVLLSRQ